MTPTVLVYGSTGLSEMGPCWAMRLRLPTPMLQSHPARLTTTLSSRISLIAYRKIQDAIAIETRNGYGRWILIHCVGDRGIKEDYLRERELMSNGTQHNQSTQNLLHRQTSGAGMKVYPVELSRVNLNRFWELRHTQKQHTARLKATPFQG